MLHATKATKHFDDDHEVFQAISQELHRQRTQIELIASENIVSTNVLKAQGSVLTNKYAEGYPGRRYYGGCEKVDIVEDLAIERAKALFSAAFANVQPHSGAQANQAVFLALLQPGDTILGMSLSAGGHLTHGAAPNMSGKWFQAETYGVSKDTSCLDYEEIAAQARRVKPKLIIAGASAYPRIIDFKKFRAIADEVGAYLMVDMAHIAGLVATGHHPSPLEWADVVTSTTHKTLRGPRGGLILSNNIDLGKKINSAIFPGLQGGPLMHVIAAKAVAFGEALQPEFKTYIQQVVENTKILSQTLKSRGVNLVSDGTDNHLALIDLRPKKLTGNVAEQELEHANITCNKNGIPFDPEKPTITSGIRVGGAAITSRGFGTPEMEQVGHLMGDIFDALTTNDAAHITETKAQVKAKVEGLTQKFPLYPDLD